MAAWEDILKHHFYQTEGISEEEFVWHIKQVGADVIKNLALFRQVDKFKLRRKDDTKTAAGTAGYTGKYILSMDTRFKFGRIIEIRFLEDKAAYSTNQGEFRMCVELNEQGVPTWVPPDEIYDAFDNKDCFVHFCYTYKDTQDMPSDMVVDELGRVISLGVMARLDKSYTKGMDYKDEFAKAIMGKHIEYAGTMYYQRSAGLWGVTGNEDEDVWVR